MVREYEYGDIGRVLEVFTRSVHEIACRDYSPVQISAWAPEHPDVSAWSERLSDGGAFVYECRGEMVGFMRIDHDGCVDLLYVHPDFQRQGIARKLVAEAYTWAREHGIHSLHAEVSLTARPFFEYQGFCVVKQQLVQRRGVSFINFRMAADLDLEKLGIAVSRLTFSDADRLADLCRRCSDFFLLAEAQPGSINTADDILKGLPPGTTEEYKYVFAIEFQNCIVGVVEMIDGYPDARTWYVGLFLLDPNVRGKGWGHAIWKSFELWMGWCGCSVVQLIVQQQNPHGRNFWESLGFKVDGETVQSLPAIQNKVWKLSKNLKCIGRL